MDNRGAKSGKTCNQERVEHIYEKHRAPARVPRAGVYGDSVPDGHSVIIKTADPQDI